MSPDPASTQPYGGRFTKEAPRNGDAEQLRKKQVRRAMVAGTVGTSIEWYDFFLYGTAAALIFPKIFFPGASAYAGALASFATYAVGFAARPVGAAFFGHFGDRIGRKATLISTLLLMGIASFLIGILPGYGTLGFWAPTLLVVLRLLQGFGVGGEWGGSVTLCMEWGNPKRRGFIGAWPQVGVPIGLLLSTGAVSLFSHISGDAFETWGWRVPFLLSIVLVGVGLWVRLGVLESPLFRREVEEERVEKLPLVEVIKRNPREIVLSALLRMSEQAPFYIFTAFVFSYGTGTLKVSRDFLLTAVLAASVLSFFSIPFFGHLSDRIGRKNMYIIGAIVTGVFGFVYFGMLNTGSAAIIFIAIILSLIPHDMMYGPQAALIAESFPGRLRYSGSSLGYQLASIIAGGPAPLIAAYLFGKFQTPYAIAWYIAACAVVSVIATALMTDWTGKDIHQEY
jgi:metabolite-proton symporter